MTQTFMNPTLTVAPNLGVSAFAETAPFQLWSGSSPADIETVIRAVYRQVLGNIHVMEQQRLTSAESQLRHGEITVREFVRQVAYSDLYQSQFFFSCAPCRSIELNFKHLLGRAPESYDEIREHSQILNEGGFYAEIDSYLDSDEYQDVFGENIVPYYRGYKTQVGQSTVGFTYWFKLLRGAASSDKSTAREQGSRLERSVIRGTPATVLPVQGSVTLTDTKELLAKVLKPATQSIPTSNVATTALHSQYQQQAEEIDRLTRQLAELRPFASIGEAIGSQWLSYTHQGSAVTLSGGSNETPTITHTSSDQELRSAISAQTAHLASLKTQIADAQRLALIGEARLNKWRRRVYF